MQHPKNLCKQSEVEKLKTSVRFLSIILVIITANLFYFSYNKQDGNNIGYSITNTIINSANQAPYLPRELSFAGEKVPLHDFEVRERMDQEILINTFRHAKTWMNLKRANRFFPLIEPILEKYKIPNDFKYLCVIESDLTNAVSPANAVGFWQILKGTALQYGLEVNDEYDERYDVEKSTEAACKYLIDAYKKFGNWTLAAASYNMGMGGLSKKITEQRVDNYYDLYLNQETSKYVFRILAIKLIFENPSLYGFNVTRENLYPQLSFTKVVVNHSIPNLVDFAIENNTNYKLLRYLNPSIRSNRLHNPSGKVYEIRIPNDAFFNYEQLKAESKYIFDVENQNTFHLYKTGDNESIEAIAAKFKISPEILEALNNQPRKKILPKGWLIVIPNSNKK